MTSVFFDFVTSYVEQSQCSCNMDQEDDTVSIDIEGITIHLTERSEAGFFMAQTGVAVLPEAAPPVKRSFWNC